MAWSSYWMVFAVCVITMIIFRVAPALLIADREMPHEFNRALGFIPAAAFSALVMNDLFNPQVWSAGIWQGLLPFIAIIPVIVVALKTKSLALCIIVGIVAYGLLSML